ncbi:hypothetical protein [Sinomonas susongensis]|uniref:hypothetical protein n=1 Tax=Sinomonas susongensis TaxID=1324851 RepID=UPI0011091A9D|nr:hypothetical protein [Sinomonas susongensis]
MTKLTLTEIATESVELLPSRDTLFLNFNFAQVMASNSSLALNAVTWGSVANSAALQSVSVYQH